MKLDLNKIPSDAIFLFIEILDKMEIDIFNLPINENMTGDEAATVIMKNVVFRIPKVKEEFKDLIEIVTGKRPDTAKQIFDAIKELTGVESLKDFFTSAD